MWNARLDESQAGIKIARRNINNLRYADDSTLKAERKEEPKSFLMRVKEESEKNVLKVNTQKTKIMASSLITTWQIEAGKSGISDRLYLLGLQNHYGQWLQPWNYKMLAPWKESYDKSRQCIQKQRHHFTDKGLCSQSYDFSSSHVQIWELDHKKGWSLKNWCFRIVVLEKTLENPLDSKDETSQS